MTATENPGEQPHLLTERRGHVLIVTMNRPHARNALSGPMLALMRLVTIALLPPAIRHEYGFAWTRRREAMFRISTRVIRAVLPLVPSMIRYWPAARRAARLRRRASSVALPKG